MEFTVTISLDQKLIDVFKTIDWVSQSPIQFPNQLYEEVNKLEALGLVSTWQNSFEIKFIEITETGIQILKQIK